MTSTWSGGQWKSGPRDAADMLRGFDEGGRLAWESSVADFCEANGSDPDLCRWVRRVRPGKAIRVGGGAVPEVEIRRRPLAGWDGGLGFVAEAAGRRVVLWPVEEGGALRYWLDDPDLGGQYPAAEVKRLVGRMLGETTMAAEASRAAWGLERENRGEGTQRAPTARQREVLSRVGETFTLADLQASACHRYPGHTRRMVGAMVARGAVVELGGERYQKTDLAVPACARPDAKAPAAKKPTKPAKKSARPRAKKGAKMPPKAVQSAGLDAIVANVPRDKPAIYGVLPDGTVTRAGGMYATRLRHSTINVVLSIVDDRPWTIAVVRPGRNRPSEAERNAATELVQEARSEGYRIDRVVLVADKVHLIVDAGAVAPVPAGAAEGPRDLTFGTLERRGDGLYADPDGTLVMVKSRKGYFVARRGLNRDGLWRVMAGPVPFAVAKSAIRQVAAAPLPPPPDARPVSRPEVELGPVGRRAKAVIRRLLKIAPVFVKPGQAIDLSAVALIPLEIELLDSARQWQVNGAGQMTDAEVGDLVGQLAQAHFRPAPERQDVFDTAWLGHRLLGYGCVDFGPLTSSMWITDCTVGASGVRELVQLSQVDDGVRWTLSGRGNGTLWHGPFTRASALLDDMVAKLRLTAPGRSAETPDPAPPGPPEPATSDDVKAWTAVLDELLQHLADDPAMQGWPVKRIGPHRAEWGTSKSGMTAGVSGKVGRAAVEVVAWASGKAREFTIRSIGTRRSVEDAARTIAREIAELRHMRRAWALLHRGKPVKWLKYRRRAPKTEAEAESAAKIALAGRKQRALVNGKSTLAKNITPWKRDGWSVALLPERTAMPEGLFAGAYIEFSGDAAEVRAFVERRRAAGDVLPISVPEGWDTAPTHVLAGGTAKQAATQPTHVLVGCVKQKRPAGSWPAAELYQGDLWALRRAYAEARALPWAIVSAEHGVIAPTEKVKPYDQRMQDHTPERRRVWQMTARRQLEALVGRGAVVEVLAGKAYVEALQGPAQALGITLVTPLAGKGIGDRKKWLGARIAELGGSALTTAAVKAAVAKWGRVGRPPIYTSPSKRVRFSKTGARGAYRVELRAGTGWAISGVEHRSWSAAARAAVELERAKRDDRATAIPPNRDDRATASPVKPAGEAPKRDKGAMGAAERAPKRDKGATGAAERAPKRDDRATGQSTLVDVGEPPAGTPDDRQLAWKIRRAAELLGRPTRGVWVVCGSQVHPIGALPEGTDVKLPAVFVDMAGPDAITAVERDDGFLLALEPVDSAIRRYRLRLDEAQRERLLNALRMARGEGFQKRYLRDPDGIKRRFTEGFKLERTTGGTEVWTDKSRTMSWTTPKGATNQQVIDGFFRQMARRLTEGLPDTVRPRAEKVLARAFRMARRHAPRRQPPIARPKPPRAPAPTSAELPAAPRADAIGGLDAYLALPKSKRPKYLIAVEDAAGVVIHLFARAKTRDQAHRVARGMLAVSPGMKLLVGKVDPKRPPADAFEAVRAATKAPTVTLDLTERLAQGVPAVGAPPRIRVQRRTEPKRDTGASGDAPSRDTPASGGTTFEMVAGRHTRHGHPIWTVRIVGERVPEDAFAKLRQLAKRVADPKSTVRTGYYSTYARQGAIPGFVFGSEAEAARFLAGARGSAPAAPTPVVPPPAKPPASASKGPEIRTLAVIEAGTWPREVSGKIITQELTGTLFTKRLAYTWNNGVEDVLVLTADGPVFSYYKPGRGDRSMRRPLAAADVGKLIKSTLSQISIVNTPKAELVAVHVLVSGKVGQRLRAALEEAGMVVLGPGNMSDAAEVVWLAANAGALQEQADPPGRTVDPSKPRPSSRRLPSVETAQSLLPADGAMLDTLTDGMGEGEVGVRHRRFGFSATIAVDWLRLNRYSVALHTRDLDVPDVDVEFLHLGGQWLPVQSRHPSNQRFDTDDGRLVDAGGQRALLRFVEASLLPKVREELDEGELPNLTYEKYNGGGERDRLDAPRVELVGRSIYTNAERSYDYPTTREVEVFPHAGQTWRHVELKVQATEQAQIDRYYSGMRAVQETDPRLIPYTPRETPASPPVTTAVSEPGDWPAAPDKPGPRTIANLRAVVIAHEAQRSGATPTETQRRQMLQYSGWGGLSIEKVKGDWPDGVPLPNARALVHEYYTPWQVCADIAAAVRRLVPADRIVRALEPSAGVGRFVQTARFPGWHWTAVELSPLSHLILSQTAGDGVVAVNGSFESYVQANPGARFDVVISNPPYGPRGEQIVEDKDRRFRVKAAYHYFILRGLSLLRPGGVAAFLVPGGFMSGSNTRKLREKVAAGADVVVAFRLPNGLFPGARLSLDVVILRARSGAAAAADGAFLDGRYFDEHPAHVLGEIKPSGRWGEPEVIGEYRGLPAFVDPATESAPGPSTLGVTEPWPELSAPPPGAKRQSVAAALKRLRPLVGKASKQAFEEVWRDRDWCLATDKVTLRLVPVEQGAPDWLDKDGGRAEGWLDSEIDGIRGLIGRFPGHAVGAIPVATLRAVGKDSTANYKQPERADASNGAVVLRAHDGHLYRETVGQQRQAYIGAAPDSPDTLIYVQPARMRSALAKAKGAVGVSWFTVDHAPNQPGVAHVMVLTRPDGEVNCIACYALQDYAVAELQAGPIYTGPNAGPAPGAERLPAGLRAIEPDAGAPKRKHRTLPQGLRAIEMERTAVPLTAAIERARFFVDPGDPILSGMRIADGLLTATDGQHLVEIAVDDPGPARVVNAAGSLMEVEYPDPAGLMPTADPVATVDPAALAAADRVLRRVNCNPVELEIRGPELLVAGERLPGATITAGSASGTWCVSLHRLRPALLGAKGGRILLGTPGAPLIIERDDGERHVIRPAADPCAICPPAAPVPAVDEQPRSPLPAPAKGPDEADLAALLSARVAAYEAADAHRRRLLYPELAAALDAFEAVFSRRLGRIAAPTATLTVARSDGGARALLSTYPAGVPLGRIADVDALLANGWRLDGERLLPRGDYLSGSLWARMAALDTIPEPYAHVVAGQRAELEAAIGPVEYPQIVDRVGLRDGWLPAAVLGAFLGSMTKGKAPVRVERRDGLLQFGAAEGKTPRAYESMTDFATSSRIRMVIGYVNHDEQVFKPKISRVLGEKLHEKRKQVAEQLEMQFKAFLETRHDLQERVADAYRRVHRGFLPRTYPGDPLDLARWGSKINPHPHQNAGARRAVDQRGMVAAYGVGVGKTFTACATIALARQKLGTKRPVILVPNSLVSKWQRDIHAALPDFAVVTIGEKSTAARDGTLRFGPDDKEDRESKWSRFAAGLYDLAIVTPAAFLRTQITPEEFDRLADGATELQRIVRLAQRTARGRTNPSERQSALLSQGVRAFLAQMMELPPGWTPDDVRWSELAVDLLVVDEAQNYKGLHTPELREGSIPRFMGQGQPSKRAWNLDARARDVRSRGGFVTLLSATPAKNSPLELYNLWSYVNGELWRDHGIHDPEAFLSRFLTIESRLVIDAQMEAAEKPAVTGFRRLDELKAILLRWGEFIQPDDIGLKVPEPTTELVEVEMDARQEAKYERYVRQIEEALDAMRRGDSNGNAVLGLLARMSLVAVHAELDRGFKYATAGKSGVNPSAPKFEAIADYILANNSCGHIVFVQAIAAHRWLKDTLVKRGIPAARIGVLNAELAKSSDARQRIADRFNEGRLDVVIANSIAYEGLDLQVRTCAIHHADLPWEPATLNQRNGRAVRQGNTLQTVAIRYYFSSRSMDGLRFNLIQGKQSWMRSLLEGSDKIANPGADLELGPDEILLLISRTPEETRARLDALRAQMEQKRRDEERKRAVDLLALGSSLRLNARALAHRKPERAAELRAEANQAFDALEKVDPEIWPWRWLLRAARAADADEILARVGAPPLFPGIWLRSGGDWYEVGRSDWRGTQRRIYMRRAGDATWSPDKVADVASNIAREDVALTRPADVADDWRQAAQRHVEFTIGDPHRGWRSTGWHHASPAWLEAAWPIVAGEVEERVAKIGSHWWRTSYGPPELRHPYDDNGRVYIQTRGGPPPAGARLLPPTAEGFERWLELSTTDDFKYALRDETSLAWWGRPTPRGAQKKLEDNPGGMMSDAQRLNPDGASVIRVPPLTPVDSHLVVAFSGVGQVSHLEGARTVTEAKKGEKDVHPGLPLAAIVRVDNNASTHGGRKCPPGPTYVDSKMLELVKPGCGLLLVADANDQLCEVRPAHSLAHAYRMVDRVAGHYPRVMVCEVRHRYSAKDG